MSTISEQARAAAIEQIDRDFQTVFTRWQKLAPWQQAAKGGPGSGFHGHAGRPGEVGGSAPSGVDSQHRITETDPLLQRGPAWDKIGSGFRGGEDAFATYLQRNRIDIDNLISPDRLERFTEIANDDSLRLDEDQIVYFALDGAHLKQMRAGFTFNAIGPRITTGDAKLAAKQVRGKGAVLFEAILPKGSLAVPSSINGHDTTVLLPGSSFRVEGVQGNRIRVSLADDGVGFINQLAAFRNRAKSSKGASVALKGGPGSGFHGHAGRPGERGGSAPEGTTPSGGGGGSSAPSSTPKTTNISKVTSTSPKPTTGGSSGSGAQAKPVASTQAIQIAKRKQSGGQTGNLLAGITGKHFRQLGFSPKIVKQLKSLNWGLTDKGQQQTTIDRILTALGDGSDLGSALQAQLDTERNLADDKLKKLNLPPPRHRYGSPRAPSGMGGSGGGRGKGEKEKQEGPNRANTKLKRGNAPKGSAKRGKADDEAKRKAAYDQRVASERKQEELQHIAKKKQKQRQNQAEGNRKVGETIYLGESPFQTLQDQGATLTNGQQTFPWPAVLESYEVFAGLGVPFGRAGDIALIRRDALPPRKRQPVKSIKGGPGSGFHGHAGRPGERGGSAPRRTATPPSTDEVRTDSESHEAALDALDFNTDPIVRAWLGGEMGSGTPWVSLRMDERIPLFKHKAVSELAEGLGISYDDANDFIRHWADSSNQHYAAQVIQQEAANLFGSPYSDWQQEQFARMHRTWEKDLDRGLDYLGMFDEIDSDMARVLEIQALRNLPFPEMAEQRFNEIFPEGLTLPYKKRSVDEVVSEVNRIKGGITQMREEQRDWVRKALQWTYNHTQADLESQGITGDILLYRGFGGEGVAGLAVGATTTVATNALSSWSASRSVATGFTGVKEGAVFAVKVPVSRVYSTPRTGFGCLNEWEFVLTGDEADEATVVYTRFDQEIKELKALPEDAMTKPAAINLDDGDENADWIKRVNGGKSRAQELAIHAQLTEAGPPAVEEDGWPDVEPPAVEEAADSKAE